MNEYFTVEETAKKWDVSVRLVQKLCKQNRISNAVKKGGNWLIPSNLPKPDKLKPGQLVAKSKNSVLNVLSLFSGCGGMDLGIEGDFDVLRKSVNTSIHPEWKIKKIDESWVHLPKTRFQTVFSNDIRPDAKRAWCNYFSKFNRGDESYYLQSIVDLVKLEKENKTNIFTKNVDLVTGGFPCQDFSVAGKRLGFHSSVSHDGKRMHIDEPSNESRGSLYMWMREVISLVKPKLFIAENVKGLTNLKDAKEIIEHDFSTIDDSGYLVIPAKVLLAADYGVPQHRERVLFFGFRKSALKPEALKALMQETVPNEYDPYPPKTHSRNGGNSLLPYVTTKDSFIGLKEPEISADLSQQSYSKAKMTKGQGQKEINLNDIGPTIRSEHHGNIEFRRLSIEHGGKNLEELNSGLKERRLTVRECARIQTFPDDYQFILPKDRSGYGVSASDAYKIIGNAVPPLLAFNIAMNLQEKWERYFK